MPLYRVVIERTEFHRAEFELDAPSEEEARETAPDIADADDYDCINARENVVSVELIEQEELDNYRFRPEQGESVGELVPQQPRTYARFVMLDEEGNIVPVAPPSIPLDEWAHVIKDGVEQAYIKRVRMRTLQEVFAELDAALEGLYTCPKCKWERMRKKGGKKGKTWTHDESPVKCEKCGDGTEMEGVIDEYLHGPDDYRGDTTPVPHNFRWVACYPVTGTSEGHYVHVDFMVPVKEEAYPHHTTSWRPVRLALAKTFRGMDHASDIARRCSILLGA